VALALMETLADFGVSSYFGIQTFTTGIYKAWLAMDNRVAAAQLATLLLVVVAGAAGAGAPCAKAHALCQPGAAPRRRRPRPSRCVCAGASLLAWVVCALPVLLGFVLPVLFMLRPLAADWSVLPWDRFVPGVQQRAAGWHQRRAGRGLVALAAGWSLRRGRAC
jgi:iron(III) transport system permease protein